LWSQQLAGLPYGLEGNSSGEPEIVTEIEVVEDTYDVFIVYLAHSGAWNVGLYASLDEDPTTLYNNGLNAGMAGEAVDFIGEGPDWTGSVAYVGQMTGSQIAVYVDDGGPLGNMGRVHYFGIGYRKAPVKVTESSGSTEVSEDGATDTIELQLLVEPTSDVTVDFTYDVDQLTVTPSQLVFEVATWDTPQSVTVGAVDDEALETDPHYQEISYASDNADPNEALAAGTSVKILENECGAWGYNQMDYDTDCDVDLADLAEFLAQYLSCTRPNDETCVDMR